jgi:2-oxoglutarate/2-oxoacid ferredoxin oxidoreductase subunit alpha
MSLCRIIQSNMDYSILIAGQAGTGLASVEHQLITLLANDQYYYFATKRYMSRIRGGSNRHMFRVADVPVNALSGKPWDLLVAFDGAGEIYRDELAKDGIYISQNDVAAIRERASLKSDDKKAANLVLAVHIFEIIKKAVTAKASHSFKIFGNQALGLGALAGGCQFMSGYPMTPATSVMDYLTHAAELLPVHFEQAEDEIAAINMAIGASYAGVRAMTASSGGGFALMQEGVSLAAMTETPLVIIEAQRPAPATGMPTRTEQADLEFVLHSGHGEFARVIYAPGDCDEAFAVAKLAFTVADTQRIPVFILTDQYLADSYMVMNTIPELTIAQRGSWELSCADSDEHDELGRITEDPLLRVTMQDKRLQKMAELKKTILPPTVIGTGDTIVLCWGSTKHIVYEAVQNLNQQGQTLQFLHCAQVYPVSKMIPNLCAHKKIIVVEQNATGQFARLLKTEFGLESIAVLKYDGDCFTVAEIEEKLHGLL